MQLMLQHTLLRQTMANHAASVQALEDSGSLSYYLCHFIYLVYVFMFKVPVEILKPTQQHPARMRWFAGQHARHLLQRACRIVCHHAFP